MVTCILGMTACGKTTEAETPLMDEASAVENAEMAVQQIAMISIQGMDGEYEDYPVIKNALKSWNSALQDIGDLKEIKSSSVITIDSEQAVVEVNIAGDRREAAVEVVMDKTGFTSITTNVKYTFGELMKKAALNTLMGMGTVFSVLILISLIISCFSIISKLQAAKSAKQPQVQEVRKEAPAVSAAPEAVEPEELTDDLELVAVISAAIAASQGAQSTDGFVVRSIKRANTKRWQRA